MGNSGIHAQQEPRFLCHAGHKTCSARTGTVFSRRRTSAETVGLVVTVRAHGGPVPALVAAWGFDERPVAAGWARAGRQGQAGQASLVERPRDVGPVHAAALRGKQPGGSGWMARAMMVTTRVWLGGEVNAQRDLPLIRRLIARVRRWAAPRPLVVCPDGVGSSIRAMRDTCRDPVYPGKGGRPRLRPGRHVLLAHVVKRSERRRVVATDRRMVAGTPARVAPLRHRAPGDGVLTTAYLALRTATCRARLAPRARHTLTRHEGMCLGGTVENFGTPQARVHPARKMTPAMAAGIPDHGWTMHTRLSLQVPLPRWAPPKRRGRPARAWQRLIERWCS